LCIAQLRHKKSAASQQKFLPHPANNGPNLTVTLRIGSYFIFSPQRNSARGRVYNPSLRFRGCAEIPQVAPKSRMPARVPSPQSSKIDTFVVRRTTYPEIKTVAFCKIVSVTPERFPLPIRLSAYSGKHCAYSYVLIDPNLLTSTWSDAGQLPGKEKEKTRAI